MQSDNSPIIVASETTGVQGQPLKRRPKGAGRPDNHATQREASPTTLHSTQLPDPEHRQAAGFVRRKPGNSVRAEPPPNPPPQTASTPRHRRPNQRKKGTNGVGNGSGSDSDSDSDSNWRPNRDGEGISVARRRPTGPSAAPETPLPNRAAIEREERARMKLFRTLQAVTEEWDHVRHRRKINHEAGERRRSVLLRRYDEMSGRSTSLPGAVLRPHQPEIPIVQQPRQDSAPRVADIRRWEANRKRFLDEVLHGHIDKTLFEGSQGSGVAVNPSDYLEDVLGRVESDIIGRCREFDPSATNWALAFQNPGLRLVAIVKALYQGLCGHLSQLGDKATDVAVDAAKFIEDNCPNRTHFRDTDALMDAYMAKIIDGLVEAVLRERSTGQRIPDPERLGLVPFIRESRHDGRMTSAYMDWICSDVEASVVEQCCVQWQKGLRREAVQTVRRTMKSIVEQEFCPDLLRPGVVSLVLFKDRSAQNIRDLSRYELMDIGWFSEVVQPSRGSEYWRHEIYPARPWGGPRQTIFKVSLDDEILGMWMPNGQFVGWDERDQRTRD